MIKLRKEILKFFYLKFHSKKHPVKSATIKDLFLYLKIFHKYVAKERKLREHLRDLKREGFVDEVGEGKALEYEFCEDCDEEALEQELIYFFYSRLKKQTIKKPLKIVQQKSITIGGDTVYTTPKKVVIKLTKKQKKALAQKRYTDKKKFIQKYKKVKLQKFFKSWAGLIA